MKSLYWKSVVNLDAAVKLPFDGAIVETHVGGGWAKLKKRRDGLYVDGRKVVFYFSERQKNGKVIHGHELREELSGKPVLNANILDALYEHPELIPEDWKRDENGNVRYIFFWGTIYRGSDGRLYVRCLYFFVGGWSRDYYWLDGGWGDFHPAALRAS